MTTLPEDLRGDGPCSNCGTDDNIVWYTDSVFWNAVVRIEPRLTDDAEILCIPCFVIMADQRGWYTTGWKLTPEFHWETKAEHAARRGAPLVSDDELTTEEQQALLQIPTHDADGVRLAEWEREHLARRLVKDRW